jgi:hypothetical protein
LLGTLHKRPPSPFEVDRRDKSPSLSAVLVPAPGAQLIGVWQVRTPIPGFAAIHQYPVEPDIVAERRRRATSRPAKRNLAVLHPMSPDEIHGVPREAQLTVRDAEDRGYLPQQITLEEVRYEPAQSEIPLREVPANALINGSVWCVFVVFDSTLDAPAT